MQTFLLKTAALALMLFVGMSMVWTSSVQANHDGYASAGDAGTVIIIVIDDGGWDDVAGSTQWTSPGTGYGEWPSWADGRYADGPQSFCAASDVAVWDDWGQVYNCLPARGSGYY